MPKPSRIGLLLSTTLLVAAQLFFASASHAAGATVSGTVTDPSGNPIPNVKIYLYTRTGEADRPNATTRADGSFSMANVPAGEYTVQFWPASQPRVAEFWGDTRRLSEATFFQVGADDSYTGVDAALADGAAFQGSFFGVVSSDSQNPRYDAEAVNLDTGEVFKQIRSDSRKYWIGVPPGRYILRFGWNAADLLVPEYFDDVPYYEGVSKAKVIEMTTGVTHRGDVEYANDWRMYGTLLNRDGTRMSNCLVEAYDPAGQLWTKTTRLYNGRFEFMGLVRGRQYNVRINGDGQCPGGVRYYDADSPNRTNTDLRSADPVTNAGNTGEVGIWDLGGYDVPIMTAAPAILGSVQVGRTLTASLGTWNLPITSAAVIWEADGGLRYNPIAGDLASNRTFQITAPEVGKSISAVLGLMFADGTYKVIRIAASSLVRPGAQQISSSKTKLRVTGTLRTGSRVSATIDAPHGTKITYQWQVRYKGKKKYQLVKGINGRNRGLTLTRKMRGARLKVVIVATRPGYLPTTRTAFSAKTVR